MQATPEQERDERQAFITRSQRAADFVKHHPEYLTDSLSPVIAQAFRPLMALQTDRRACPSEVKRVIPSLVLSECDAMRKTLNEADQRSMSRRFTGAAVTQFGGLE
jgi:hypothetical protein